MLFDCKLEFFSLIRRLLQQVIGKDYWPPSSEWWVHVNLKDKTLHACTFKSRGKVEAIKNSADFRTSDFWEFGSVFLFLFNTFIHLMLKSCKKKNYSFNTFCLMIEISLPSWNRNKIFFDVFHLQLCFLRYFS